MMQPAGLPTMEGDYPRVERRPSERVARAVARVRDLRDDAGIDGAVGPVGQLEMPIVIVLVLVHPSHPSEEAVGPQLAVGTRRAVVARAEEWRRPGREHRRYGRRLRGDGDSGGVDLLGPTVMGLATHLCAQGRSSEHDDEAEPRAYGDCHSQSHGRVPA